MVVSPLAASWRNRFRVSMSQRIVVVSPFIVAVPPLIKAPLVAILAPLAFSEGVRTYREKRAQESRIKMRIVIFNRWGMLLLAKPESPLPLPSRGLFGPIERQ